MSGITGDSPIQSRDDYRKILHEVETLISAFPGFVSLSPSGSYNSNKSKDTFGDMDVICHINGVAFNNDKNLLKKELIKFLLSNPCDIISPFSSEKYSGRRFYNSGEIVTISFISKGVSYSCQVDFIIAMDKDEKEFKQDFLNMPAAKQGIILGLVKTVLIEETPEKVLFELDIRVGKIENNQELEFNVSSKEIQLRLVTFDSPGSFKEISREVIWKDTNWKKLKVILSKFNLDDTFEGLVDQAKRNLKNPRSRKRVAGIFSSMVSVKSGEVVKPKGNVKQADLDLVRKTFCKIYR